MNELVVSRDELRILLNSIYHGACRYLTIHDPFLDVDLFRLDLRTPRIFDVVNREALSSVLLDGKSPSIIAGPDEFNGYQGLFECFLSSGLVSYKNRAEVAKKLAELREESKNPFKSGQPIFLAPDTNLLYTRFFSRHFPMVEGQVRDSIEATDFRYVVSDVVKFELSSRIVQKYSADEIARLQGVYRHRELLKQFQNQCKKRGRKAKLALNEYNHLVNNLKGFRVTGTSEQGREYNDIAICKSYKSWVTEKKSRVHLLTSDREMVNHALVYELEPILLELPASDIPSSVEISDSWKIADLLFDLTTVLGAIELKHEGIFLQSEWVGKGQTDYTVETVKATTKDPQKLVEVERQIKICRAIMDSTTVS